MASLINAVRTTHRRTLHSIFTASGNTTRTSLSPLKPLHNIKAATVKYNQTEKDEEHDEGDEEHSHYSPSHSSSRSKSVEIIGTLHSGGRGVYVCQPVRLQQSVRRYSTVAAPSSSGDKKKVAVILSGSGVHDGTEINEAVSVMVHLSRAGIDARCFAPDMVQADLINHVKGSPSAEGSRNVLTESARIARGKIKALSQLQTEKYEALIFPGGFGAAKNLCTFANNGENCTVQTDVARVFKEFHKAKKPIGMLCVSPVIAAKLIPGVTITLGNEDTDIQDVVSKMGAKPTPVGVSEVVVDETNNIISSPAYMTNSPVHKVFDGIGKLVETVLSRIEQTPK